MENNVDIQIENEYSFILSLKIITSLLENNFITKTEFDKINKLNIESFNPKMSDIY